MHYVYKKQILWKSLV